MIFSNPGPRLLWSCSTSPFGAGLSTSTGLSLQTPVCCASHRLHLVLTRVEQCSAATNHLITNAVFNISSDLIILSIPLPLLFRVRLPKKNKAILFSVFLIGAFTYVILTSFNLSATNAHLSIVAAALNKYYSFTNPFGTEWTIWYLRESYTAILCANLPLIYPLIQRVFKLRNWHTGTYNTNNQYQLDSGTRRTSRFIRLDWNSNKPKPAHHSYRGMVRRTDNEDAVGYSIDEERRTGSQFITSAIDMDDLRDPVSPSLASPDWRAEDKSKEERTTHPGV
jgi:hypothetical protein